MTPPHDNLLPFESRRGLVVEGCGPVLRLQSLAQVLEHRSGTPDRRQAALTRKEGDLFGDF